MPAHSKTPCITPSVEFSPREGVVRGRRVQQLAFALANAIAVLDVLLQCHPNDVGCAKLAQVVYDGHFPGEAQPT